MDFPCWLTLDWILWQDAVRWILGLPLRKYTGLSEHWQRFRTNSSIYQPLFHRDEHAHTHTQEGIILFVIGLTGHVSRLGAALPSLVYCFSSALYLIRASESGNQPTLQRATSTREWATSSPEEYTTIYHWDGIHGLLVWQWSLLWRVLQLPSFACPFDFSAISYFRKKHLVQETHIREKDFLPLAAIFAHESRMKWTVFLAYGLMSHAVYSQQMMRFACSQLVVERLDP